MVSINPFKLERFFARYEFTAPYLLSPSDCESLRLDELLRMADAESRALWESLSLGYTESPGHPRLRAEIARLYETVRPEDALVVAPEEGIFIALQTLLSPGEEAIVLHPAYQSLYEVVNLAGGRAVRWPLLLTETGWRLDLPALERLLTPRTRLLVINFPHNPTGFLPSRAEVEALVEFARRAHLVVFSDEMYRLLEYAPESRLPSVADLYEQGIALSGMSKTLSLPGLRIGWLATRIPGLLERLQRFKDYTTICSSAPGEALALMGLRARDRILERNLAILRENLATAGAFFARYPGVFTWVPPLAGSVAFPRWDGAIPVEAFCEALVDQQGVMLVPGSIFDFPGSHFRLGLGRKNFPEALARVEAFLDGKNQISK